MKKLLFIIAMGFYSFIIACCICPSAHAQTWKANAKYIGKDTAKAQYQCWGTTKKGERCKRHVKIDHSFCYQHANQSK